MVYNISKTFTGILIILVLFSFEACSKKNMNEPQLGTESTDGTGFTKIPDNNISESDADLFNVNYKEFYDELSQHGKWIEVNAKDIGLEGLKGKGTASGEIEDKQEFLSHVFGIKDANAETVSDVDWGVFFVWSPDPSLAVSVAAGEPANYVPYADGEWYYTDDGWYFAGATQYEDVTFHYGRWVMAPEAGWIWVPGRVWAPSWVEWYDNDDYIAWGPIPPRCYFTGDVITYPWFDDDDRFVCVEKRHFLDPDVYRYRYFYNEHENPVRIRDMRRVDGLYAKDNVIMNRGPEVKDIQDRWGRNVDKVNLEKVHDRSAASFSGNQMKVYTPQFSRSNNSKNVNSSVSRPKSYVSYNNLASNLKSNGRMNSNNRSSSGNNNISGNQRSQNKNGNKSWNYSGRNKGSMGSNNYNSGKNKSQNNGYSKGNNNKSRNNGYNKNNNGNKSKSNGSYSPKGRNQNNSSRKQSEGNRNQGSDRNSGRQNSSGQNSGSHGNSGNNSNGKNKNR